MSRIVFQVGERIMGEIRKYERIVGDFIVEICLSFKSLVIKLPVQHLRFALE